MKVDKRKIKIFKEIDYQLDCVAGIFANRLLDYGYGEVNFHINGVYDENTLEIEFSIHGWEQNSIGDYKSNFKFCLRIPSEIFNDDDKLNNFINEEIHKVNEYIKFDER